MDGLPTVNTGTCLTVGVVHCKKSSLFTFCVCENCASVRACDIFYARVEIFTSTTHHMYCNLRKHNLMWSNFVAVEGTVGMAEKLVRIFLKLSTTTLLIGQLDILDNYN